MKNKLLISISFVIIVVAGVLWYRNANISRIGDESKASGCETVKVKPGLGINTNFDQQFQVKDNEVIQVLITTHSYTPILALHGEAISTQTEYKIKGSSGEPFFFYVSEFQDNQSCSFSIVGQDYQLITTGENKALYYTQRNLDNTDGLSQYACYFLIKEGDHNIEIRFDDLLFDTVYPIVMENFNN